MSSPKKKASIDDVASRAGVSITTVSRIINNVPTVSPKNRAKVEEAIAHFKYKPNVSAQRLAKGSNSAIGLVIPGFPGIFHSFYAIEVIRGVGHACESLRLDMVFHITNGMNPLNPHTVGGLVFADLIENRKQVEAALAVGAPCMIINHQVEDLDVHYIAIDNHQGGELAGDYLASLGHKRIATITGSLSTQAGLFRLNGFKKALKKKDTPLPEEYIYQGDYSRRSARAAMEQFLDMDNPPTAVFAASDEMALEAMGVIMERGLKVPDDISIIGFDDNPICLYGPVGLTTIKQPIFEMAQEGVELLHTMMNEAVEPKTKKKTLPTDLVIRESCAGPKQS